METTVTFINPIKVIKSENKPSTNDLDEGNLAYGENGIYGRIDDQIVFYYSAVAIDLKIGDINLILDAINGEEI